LKSRVVQTAVRHVDGQWSVNRVQSLTSSLRRPVSSGPGTNWDMWYWRGEQGAGAEHLFYPLVKRTGHSDFSRFEMIRYSLDVYYETNVMI